MFIFKKNLPMKKHYTSHFLLTKLKPHLLTMKHTKYAFAFLLQVYVINCFAQVLSDYPTMVDIKLAGSSGTGDAKKVIADNSSVNYYKGALQFNLPLYTLVEKNLEVPIILGSNIQEGPYDTYIAGIQYIDGIYTFPRSLPLIMIFYLALRTREPRLQ